VIKIFTVVGARPQFIKAAVVSRALSLIPDFCEVLVHTGQHYDANMSEIFFDELDIPRPNYNLGIGGGGHGKNTGRMLEGLEELMILESPDWVLVYGDTDSTLAGALAASKLHIPIAHVEAGLRSFNRRMPEEINRVLTDHLASCLFAPTEIAVQNLENEGIDNSKIIVVGDVMYDAALHYRPKSKKLENSSVDSILSGRFVLCTVHRAENTDNFDCMKNIFDGLSQSPLPVILPIHPRTKIRMATMGIIIPSNVHIIDPVSYLEMIWLEINSEIIITDSGGVQKEAYFHRRPCITMRNETEWMELVDLGVNCLVGVDFESISSALNKDWGTVNFDRFDLYGSGNAGHLIAKNLKNNSANGKP
jgi:UDP-GlcNAc3NAcA epimerase